ncbi:ABC transporter permease [Chitinophaga horti]|uniref:ABC transporter permease n=1 Tax=Chitinophaga horti TaxID=2920382 RepID=A0ABY6IX92_9BACT|nr:ABC transporter permease [Chitinophaga horti]UYQ92007.1 ABC transporter permease [Chitinophaga horti]
MLHIIRTEWLKVKSYRTFWVLFGVAIVFIPAINTIVAEVNRNVKDQSKGIINVSLYDFSTVWQMIVNVNTNLTIFFGFLLVILVTNEFTFKTHRQNIIDGWERREFILAKFFWVVALSVISLLVTVITGLIMGSVYGTSSVSFDHFESVWFYFGQTILMLTLALLAGVFIRRAGLAIVLYLAYTMGAEQILVMLGKKYLGSVASLLPMQAADEMMPQPMVGKMIPNVDLYPTAVYAVATVAYIGLFAYLVYRKMSRADL